MGSGKKITTTKKPRRIMESGEGCGPENPTGGDTSGGDGAGGGVECPGVPLTLLVPVVSISDRVHRVAKVGDPVSLVFRAGSIGVTLRGDELGVVEPSRESEVRQRGARAGVLESLASNPARARILVS